MEYFTLSNGNKMPMAGIGVFMMSPAEAEEAVESALKSGVRLIDTANGYMNESGTGRGIKKSGVAREEIFLVTKLWPTVYEKETAIQFTCQSAMLFITLPSGRRLAYVKPKIDFNKFGGESVTYEGVGTTKKWERIESYGPKFVENIVQAISRDILCYAMQTLSHCFICGHIHDELIIEASKDVDLQAVCEQMGRVPPWLPGAVLRADGYECGFYMKS